MNVVIATIKSWNIIRSEIFKANFENTHNIYIITNRYNLSLAALEIINPYFFASVVCYSS